MGAYDLLDPKLRGLKQGVGQVDRISTLIAAEDIPAGNPVMGYAGEEDLGYNPKSDELEILLDADLVTANVYTITLTINGVAQTPVAETFDTDHNTTMDNMIAALEAAFPNMTFTLTDATNNREITCFYKGNNLNSATAVVTLGASQAGTTITEGTQQIFMGVAMFTQRSLRDSVGVYKTNQAINVMEQGWITVEVFGAVSANQPVYAAVLTIANQGKFGASGYATGAKFRENASADGDLVIIEVNSQNEDTTK